MTNATFRFVYPFLPVIARGLGIGIERAGLLLSARWGAGLVAPAALGLVRRHIPSRRLMVWGIAGFSVSAGVTAASNGFLGALAGFTVLGLSKPFVDIAGQSHIAARTPYAVRARYIGILEMSWAGGLLIGAPVAGWLIAGGDWRRPFWVFASLGVVGIGAALTTLSPDDGPTPGTLPVTSDPDVGRRIGSLLAAIALVGFAHESVLVVVGSWLESGFGLTLLALGGVGTLLGASDLAGEIGMVALTDRIGKRRSIVVGVTVAAAGLVGLAVTSGRLVPAMIALVVTMLGAEFGFISAIPLATELRPADRTRVLGWFYLATGGGRIVGDITAPGTFGLGGMPAVAGLSAVAMLAAAVMITTRRRNDP